MFFHVLHVNSIVHLCLRCKIFILIRIIHSILSLFDSDTADLIRSGITSSGINGMSQRSLGLSVFEVESKLLPTVSLLTRVRIVSAIKASSSGTQAREIWSRSI